MGKLEPAASSAHQVGLLDTWIFIACESRRRLNTDLLPPDAAVSVVTIGELELGVLLAPDEVSRSQRLGTLNAAFQLQPTPVDDRVANAWALLREQLRANGQRMEVNESWIAATAMARGWALVTQDAGFPDDIDGLTIVRA